MATEEELAKVDIRGIKSYPYVGPGRQAINEGIRPKASEIIAANRPEVAPPSAADAGSAVGNYGVQWLTGANDTVRNTSPVREIYGAVSGVKNFVGGLAGTTSVASPQVAEAAQQTAPTTSTPQAETSNRDFGLRRMPAEATPVAQPVLTGGITSNLTPRDQALKRSISEMDAIIKSGVDPGSGKPITPEQIAKVNQIKQQAGFLRGGTDRVPVGPDGLPLRRGARTMTDSGLDIQFSPDISQATRTRVMQSYGASDPVAQGLRAQQFQQFDDREFARNNRPASSTPDLFTKANSPGMGSKERRTLNQQLLANAAADKEARIKASTEAAGFRTQKEVAAMQEGTAAEKNRIYAEDTASQGAYRDVQAAQLPLEGESVRGFRTLQGEAEKAKALLDTQLAKQSKTTKYSTETVDPRTFEKTRSEVGVDGEGNVIDPFGIRNKRTDTIPITAKEQAVLAKHFGSRKDVTQQEIGEYLKTIR